MDIPLDEVLYFDCITSHPTTGAATDADSTPTFAVYEEATDTDIGVGGNLTKRTSLTGNYRGTFTASAANGFEVGKWYSIIGSATVNSVAGKAVLKNFRVVAAESVAGTPKADMSALGGVAQSAADLKDFADTGYDPATHKVAGVVTADTATALGAAYDAAKTAAQAGDEMNLVDAPNATAVTAIQSGLATAAELAKTPGIGRGAFRHTNTTSGETADVSIGAVP